MIRNETQQDWAACEAVMAYRADAANAPPMSERTLNDYLAEKGLKVVPMSEGESKAMIDRQTHREGGDGLTVNALIDLFFASGYDDTKAGIEAFQNFSPIKFFEMYRAAPPSGNAGERPEPVAWRSQSDFGQWSFSADPLWDTSEPLYAAPPQPAPDAVREALQKMAEWVDIKDPRHPETASGEEVEYGNGYSAGLRAAGKFARAALSPPSPSGEPLVKESGVDVGTSPCRDRKQP